MYNFSWVNLDEDDIINFCKCCCIEYDEKDYEKDNQFFCYCYQAKRKQKWLNNFLTNNIQQRIVPYLLEYFILRMSIIGFEKQYEINRIDFELVENYIFIGIFIGTFFLFFYFTFSFSKFYKILIGAEYYNNENLNQGKEISNIGLLSNEILSGVNGILFFNSLFSLILSSIFHSTMGSENKEFIFSEHNYIILIPILMGKFYHFTLNYYCISYSEDNKKFELISGSTLISFYLLIWEFIISLIKSSCDEKSINALYITQLVISCLVILYFLIIMISFIISKTSFMADCCDFLNEIEKLCFCFLLFCFCCAGFWYSPEVFDHIDCENSCTCECDCESCIIEWSWRFNCCFCKEDNYYYVENCCDEFNFCDICDYIINIVCCCGCCCLCCDCCKCCHCKEYFNCCSCNCKSCCDNCACCGCCGSGYCCLCCDCCEIIDICECCDCIYCCGENCIFECC